MARLIGPAEYGLYAVVSVVLAFSTLLAEAGLSSSVIRSISITETERSAIFWLNFVLCSVVSVCLIVVSGPLAALLGHPALSPALALCSGVVWFSAMSWQFKVDAEKLLQFRAITLIEVASSAGGFFLAIALAMRDAGVYSIVFGNLFAAATGAIACWLIIARCDIPRKKFHLRDVAKFLGYSSALLGSRVANSVNTTSDLMVGTRLLSAADLGAFSVPRNLVLQIQMVLNPIVTRVAFPLIARAQHDKTLVRSIYLKTLNATTSLNAPVYVGLATYAPEFTRLFLGSAWGHSAYVLRILCLWGLLRAIGNPVGSLLMGVGKTNRAFKWDATMMLFLPVVVFLGAHWGSSGIAISLLLMAAATFVPFWFFLVRDACDAGFGEYCAAVSRPILISVIAILPVHILTSGAILGIWGRLIVGFFVSGALYALLSACLNRELLIAGLSVLKLRPAFRRT